jgi:hypothetical protein
MRFVEPEVVRYELKSGDWVELKKELSVGEEKAFRSAGLRHMKQDGGESAIVVDWAAMATARVEAYLVGWSAKGQNGKPLAVTATSIKALHKDDFEEIDKLVEKHMEATGETKNEQSGGTTSTTSQSPSL